MKRSKSLIYIGVFTAHITASFVHGAAIPTPVISSELSQIALYGDDADKQIIAVQHEPFKYAVRITTYKKPAFTWDMELALPSIAPVAKWDSLLGTFYARCVGSQQCTAKTEYVFAMNKPPYTPSARMMVELGPNWQKFQIPFTMNEDYAAGETKLRFRLGFDPQSIEIGGIETVDYSSGTKVQDLPKSIVSYSGREVNVDWRNLAESRIEKIRKADLAVLVKDAAGHPIPGADVEVRMQKHSFSFGVGLSAEQILDPTNYGEKNRNAIKKLFNTVALENDLKWPWWERNPKPGLDAVRWLNSNGFSVRGHCLIWAGWNHVPKNLYELKDKPEDLRNRVNSHIREEVTRLRGQVVEWDAINEQYGVHALIDILGKNSLVEWLKIARSADPEAKLILNEDDIIEDAAVHADHRASFYDSIRFLLDHDAPFDGIGLQGHFSWLMTPPGKILEILDQVANFKKPIEISEFNIDVPDEKLQADYTRDFMTVVFSHPAVNGIITWDILYDPTWKTDTTFFREDGSIKPNGEVWKNLVLRRWWTNSDGATDRAGQYFTRGFLGDYKITVVYKGKKYNEMLSLPKSGKTIVVVVDSM